MYILLNLLILIFQFENSYMQCSYSALGHADYIGCFVENGMFPYTYGDRYFESLTIDFCLLGCADDGFKYAGMMSRQWCQCDNDLYSDTNASKVSDSECDTPCYGNGSQMCGGDYMLSIYHIREVKSVPTFQQFGTVFNGRAISNQPLKSEVIHSDGVKTKVDCANACGGKIDCKLFSISSQTKLCHMFEQTIKLCDANITDPNSSIYLLL